MLRSFLLVLGTAVSLCGASLSIADEAAYHLYDRDVVTFAVHGETDLTTSLRISGNGTINVPLLGDVHVTGLTLADAERKIQDSYIKEQIFIRPQITLQVSEYSKKEISMLGQFARQGKIELPPESSSLSIIEAVSSVGGFTRIGRSDSVRVTRKDPETGEEKIFTVNVERMISGHGNEDVFRVYPGDILFVPERLF
jgi:protein involved in polysaccharide export with SLBB domain